MHDSLTVRQLFAASMLATMLASLARAAPAIPERMAALGFARTDAYPPPRNFFALRKLALRDSIVRVALAQVGTRYVFGGTSPDKGFDCSGLVRYVFSRVYLVPPRTARLQARLGSPVGREHLLPGDLLAFGRDHRVSHIGIYVGEGRFVHASSVAGHVVLSRVDRPPTELIRPLTSARRLLAVANARKLLRPR